MTLLTTVLILSVQSVTIPSESPPVVYTVADLIRSELFEGLEVVEVGPGETGDESTLRVGVAGQMPWELPVGAPEDEPWLYVRVNPDGGEAGSILASHENFLMAAYELVRERIETGDRDLLDELSAGILIKPTFKWLTGREDVHMSRLGYVKKRTSSVTIDDIEASFREAARLGCTHVVVNEPTSPFPHESGPEGEIYYRFYAYALDLDQYVETKLNRGTYPRDLLDANLSLMKRLARLAAKYGLTPGMFVANPRSVPESLLERYPFLRGARVDHTFRAFEPRYTLSLAHPAVRWHYATMLRQLLAEVPELGFMITLLNDSGSGFEYTSSLYPGRNGGPYVVREWRPDEEIARAAAENVIRYYRLMRDTAQEINPDFRILTGLKNIAEEAEIILDGLDNGLDLRMRSQRSDYDEDWRNTMLEFRERGSEMTGQTRAKGSPILVGVPSPWHVWSSLENLSDAGYRHVGVDIDPVFLSASDVNREVLRAFQLSSTESVDQIVERFAVSLVGPDQAADLVEVWRLADRAVASTPRLPLYGGQGFVWYRFWVRPFVPDIGRIPDADRAYYQDYMLSVFNNPHNVDFGADALWTIHGQEESDRLLAQFDAEVWAPLDAAVNAAHVLVEESSVPATAVVEELRDRLLAYRSYARTLRNITSWISGVHGYIGASDDSTRAQRLEQVREMVEDELANARELLTLWESSKVDFIPLTEHGETMHTYGLNLGDLIRHKIELMERFGDAAPHIDPNYMWRMPDGVELDPDEYLSY